ncbi:hypothetical protein N7517_008162 [Penicillium concentricum]|uniref:Uncharacterized protein n=1 Tax=Penicillium concentricum TaxID=293559 RepID=A0A9W9V3W0_9EURO|nr:uncharacterized protein N7517_008162 [Penicillium concentricum]KAJ5365276.1 hypothetical protein N7517_008162 [Penicillium concentricum]
MDELAFRTRLNSLIEQYTAANPKSKAAFNKAQQFLPAGSTRSVLYSAPFPLVIESAEGCTVTSLDGQKYIDFVSDFSAGLYGHSHPVIHKAVHDALAKGFNLGGIITQEAQLGQILCDRFPSIERVRFCNSGTEANMYALATALEFTKRKKVLVFKEGYHGGTLSFSAAGNTSPLNLPHEYVFGTYNDIEATRPLIDKTIGAILIEPMQAVGGMKPSSKEFLQSLRDAADEYGVVLIFDEVVTSRFHFHGLQGAWQVTPDLTTLGKYLGGGFSFGAFGGRAQIMSLFDPTVTDTQTLSHSGTFNNNVFSMTAAVAASQLVTEKSLSRINGLGDRLRQQANEIAHIAGHKSIEFTGYGSAVGVHFHGPSGVDIRDAFYFHLIQEGIFIGRRGFVSLNLQHTDAEVDRVLKAIQKFAKDYSQI